MNYEVILIITRIYIILSIEIDVNIERHLFIWVFSYFGWKCDQIDL